MCKKAYVYSSQIIPQKEGGNEQTCSFYEKRSNLQERFESLASQFEIQNGPKSSIWFGRYKGVWLEQWNSSNDCLRQQEDPLQRDRQIESMMREDSECETPEEPPTFIGNVPKSDIVLQSISQ